MKMFFLFFHNFQLTDTWVRPMTSILRVNRTTIDYHRIKINAKLYSTDQRIEYVF